MYSQFKLCKILSSAPAELVTTAALSKETPSTRHQRNSSFPGCQVNSLGKPPSSFGSTRLSAPAVLRENRDLDYSVLNSRVAMTQFRRFLRETIGEKYLFFWLDVERAQYFHKPVDQHRFDYIIFRLR